MKFQIITLFPSIFGGVFNSSMLWKAHKEGITSYDLIDLREFGLGSRKTVDDSPYGGGSGMVLMVEPLFAAIEYAKSIDPLAEIVLMTPRGEDYSQRLAREFSENGRGKILICGRYEGYDERITTVVDRQISIGNYVLTGGELPAMILVDSITRLLPGVLGGETSAIEESFENGSSREYPHYTRPEEFRGLKVPDVLLSGNHAEISKWREDNKK